MKLTLNRDYARRHLFVTLLMLGLGLWFGYDGFIRYPNTPAAELYRSIEGSDAPASTNLEAFKRQKTQTQYGFTFLSLLASLIVGLRLYRASKFQFEWNEATLDEVDAVDNSNWEKKSIIAVTMKSGKCITLDAWHHTGVKEFYSAWQNKNKQLS